MPATTASSPAKRTVGPSSEPAQKVARLDEPVGTLQVLLDPAHPNAKLPTRGSALAAGYDLYASDKVTLAPWSRSVVPTGIRVAIPAGCYGRVAPRSGLAVKHGIDTGAGVVDADYRGLLGVVLFNLSPDAFEINAGDRIAQLVLERIHLAEVEQVQTLDDTDRGAGGFGSTGGFNGK